MFLAVFHLLAVMSRGFSCRLPWQSVLDNDRRRGMSASVTEIGAMLNVMNEKRPYNDHSINGCTELIISDYVFWWGISETKAAEMANSNTSRYSSRCRETTHSICFRFVLRR